MDHSPRSQARGPTCVEEKGISVVDTFVSSKAMYTFKHIQELLSKSYIFVKGYSGRAGVDPLVEPAVGPGAGEPTRGQMC
ncbi:hypothetical protein NHX12_028584 [Muraenolepis orangiensis]|uniref:Uncharacterized protein n=1 Tax=Muraenolepis orangiensis TaxID=630683 RepID=A0A9Q0EE04_9TELE|nr:hypothetical protein NHX12_028584 [Muraenolepis orangiensis]